ncbi:unnamed protein product [Ranitomeya imitator]|uniref:Esterase OVCA2 n=1 Tax=Ranitomeya imitator TaxID=111125 RepID=A0ABN9M839_9NEOB|nr:unnamed protein product [Ranitomeya imitator]
MSVGDPASLESRLCDSSPATTQRRNSDAAAIGIVAYIAAASLNVTQKKREKSGTRAHSLTLQFLHNENTLRQKLTKYSSWECSISGGICQEHEASKQDYYVLSLYCNTVYLSLHVDPKEGEMEDPRGWWFSDPEKSSFHAMDETNSCAGLEESLDTVAKAFSELGPFDGILGFSQGAAFVAMLCALKQQGDPRFQFNFAILVGGFKSRATEHARFYREAITVPSLHVYGDTDKVIPGEMSQDLAAHFVNPLLLTHPGGHFIPVCATQKKVYFPFLDSFRK